MTNPFEVLGLDPHIAVCPVELEARYMELSREHHPDFNPETSAEDQVAVLQRSAEINDAYRTLKNPWQRAEAMIELDDPEALEATKTLCPMFLMEAMEVREATSEDPPEKLPALQKQVEAKVEQYFADVAAHLEAGETRQAATLLHQSNYYRKALTDLRNRIDSEL